MWNLDGGSEILFKAVDLVIDKLLSFSFLFLLRAGNSFV